jgi:hypothetical protein
MLQQQFKPLFKKGKIEQGNQHYATSEETAALGISPH